MESPSTLDAEDVSIDQPSNSNFSMLNFNYIPFEDRFDTEDVDTITSRFERANQSILFANRLKSPELLKDNHISYAKNIMTKKFNHDVDESLSLWNTSELLLPLFLLNADDFDECLQQSKKFLQKRIRPGHLWTEHLYNLENVVIIYGLFISIIMMGEDIYGEIDQQEVYNLLFKFKRQDGSFSLSPVPFSEVDLRSTFCAIYLGWMFDVLTPELTKGVLDYVVRCQNYDGGFSPSPECESHGGYTFCAVGILHIFSNLNPRLNPDAETDVYNRIDVNKLIRFLANRQDPFSGGYNGRTNKLVDTCYSFWVGSPSKTLVNDLKIPVFWNDEAMRNFLLACTQSKDGGFCDRPPSSPDRFHTMFGFAGLKISGMYPGFPEIDTITGSSVEASIHMIEYFRNKNFVPKK